MVRNKCSEFEIDGEQRKVRIKLIFFPHWQSGVVQKLFPSIQLSVLTNQAV